MNSKAKAKYVCSWFTEVVNFSYQNISCSSHTTTPRAGVPVRSMSCSGRQSVLSTLFSRTVMHACSSYHSHTFKEHRDRELTFAEFSARQVITHMLFVVHHIKSGCASLYNVAIIFAIVAVHMCIHSSTQKRIASSKEASKSKKGAQADTQKVPKPKTSKPGYRVTLLRHMRGLGY